MCPPSQRFYDSMRSPACLIARSQPAATKKGRCMAAPLMSMRALPQPATPASVPLAPSRPVAVVAAGRAALEFLLGLTLGARDLLARRLVDDLHGQTHL